jgi:hypothetical protein
LLVNFVLLAVALAIASPASAADRYAVPGGTGSSATCSQAAPCNLADAIDNTKTANGDNVILAPGDYAIASPITVFHALTLDSTGTAANTRINSSYSASAALALNNVGATFSDFTFNAPSATAGFIGFNGTAKRIAINTGALTACLVTAATLTNSVCRSTATGGFGINFTIGSGITQMNLTNDTIIGGPNGTGLYVKTTGSGIVSINATNSIFLGDAASVKLAAADAASITTLTADHSNYLPVVTEAGIGTIGATPAGTATNQTAPPSFTNATAGDYSEAAGSPTIDAGVIAPPAGDLDLVGLARSQGAAPDIGAYEFAPPAPPPAAKDTTKPKIKVSKKPKSKTTSKKLKVVFKANEPATFRCKLDKGKFKKCKSPYKKTVKRGKHRLQIKATDAAGNVSSTKTIKWTVIRH